MHYIVHFVIDAKHVEGIKSSFSVQRTCWTRSKIST